MVLAMLALSPALLAAFHAAAPNTRTPVLPAIIGTSASVKMPTLQGAAQQSRRGWKGLIDF